MKWLRIEIPEFQNWSCHGCSDCCRGQLLIAITPEEKACIEKQNWTKTEGVDPKTMIVSQRGIFRLGHQDSGACVFLDENGRCRIHAKFGEAAKPLACRLYPLVIHPAGNKLVAGIRFSCPSAAANRGTPLPQRAGELRLLAGEVVPKDFQEGPPPVVAATDGEWEDFLRFVKWMDVSLSSKDVPIALKLLRTLHWLHAIQRGELDRIFGESADEILEALVTNADTKVSALSNEPEEPTRMGKVFFRMMVMEYARAVTMDNSRSPWRYRWRMLRAFFRFLPANGRTPKLREGLDEVEFSRIENLDGTLPAAAEEMLTRYFRLKVQSLHFCGRAFYRTSLTEGFRSLAILFPIIIWIARWLAVSDKLDKISDADVTRAITMVDYHYSYSPYQRWRIKLLTQRNDIVRLCEWYGRNNGDA